MFMRRFALIALAGFTLAVLPAFAVEVETKFSPEFQVKLHTDYGDREGPILASSLSTALQHAFKTHSDVARVVVTINNAEPNKPTFFQMGKNTSLDPIRSRSIGGATLTGTAFDASGHEIGSFDYKWYETDLREVRGYATWHDADWTFDRFASQFARKVK